MPSPAVSIRPSHLASPTPWDWLVCVCGKRICRGAQDVIVSVVRTPATQIGVFCRDCKREIFLAVRK